MKGKIVLALVPLVLLAGAAISQARVDSFTAGLDTGVDIDHYSYKKTTTQDGRTLTPPRTSYNRLVATPSFDLKSDSDNDSIELKYALGLKYDLNGNGTDVDHNLNLSAQRSWTKNWKMRLNDRFIKSDDTNLTSTTTTTSSPGGGTSNPAFTAQGNSQSTTISPLQDNTTSSGSGTTGGLDQVSNDYGRHRFWTNGASLDSDYTYHEDSVVSLGYSYSVLRNDNTDLTTYQDYDKHDGSAAVSYRFGPRWKTSLDGHYIRGLYPASGQNQTGTTIRQSDLNEYHGDAGLEYDLSSRNAFLITYGYIGSRYDDTTFNKDADIHQGQLSWRSKFTPHFSTDLGGGPSYIKQQDQGGKTGYNAHARLNYALEHGFLGLGVDKTYAVQNFSGTGTGGYVDGWTARGNVGYQFFKELSSGLFVSFSDQNHNNANLTTTAGSNESYTEKISSAGLTLNYGFWRWYTVTLGYTFTHQEADTNLINQFDEHRVYLTLGAKKELFRW